MSIQYYAHSDDPADKFLEVFTKNRDYLPSDFINNTRVFVIGEKKIIRAIYGKISIIETHNSYGFANITTLDRGHILDIFSKLEFLVNEIINLYFLSASSEKVENLSYIIRKLPFRQRIEAIKHFGLISSSLEKKLKNLSSTRNILAHEWDEKSSKYDGDYLENTDTLEKLNRALTSVYTSLIEEYKKLQLNTEYQEYLSTIIDKMNSYAESHQSN